MHGDFSRDTFSRLHRFSRVLMQQGRVLLDADWNEQTSILLHYVRALAADVIGPHGGSGDAFRIGCTDAQNQPMRFDFTIGRGHYWVNGILCENEPPESCMPPAQQVVDVGPAGSGQGVQRYTVGGTPPLTFRTQPHLPLRDDDDPLQANHTYLVYLDVWEQAVTHLQADHVREVALGGADTAARARVVWQVRAIDQDDVPGRSNPVVCQDVMRAVKERRRCLRARARVPEPSEEPCIIPPEASYRGLENQLYRVEIHDGGTMESTPAGPTFKWSRDNGSVVFGIRSLQGSVAVLDTLGPDDRRTLVEGDWVEMVDDHSALRGERGVLARVESVDRLTFQVTLSVPGDGALLPFHAGRHPLLRRWDQGSAAVPVQEGRWVDLEDGVQVLFERGGTYRTGDYWLIPARTATGDVLWPTEPDEQGAPRPVAMRPHGVEHHYAPLGIVRVDGNGNVTCDSDCRCVFMPLCAPGSGGQNRIQQDTTTAKAAPATATAQPTSTATKSTRTRK